MRIVGSLDQLHIYPDVIRVLLHASFQDVGNSELSRDLRQIFGCALIMLCRSARDNFQVGNLGQAGEDLVLNAVGKVSVVRVSASIFKRKHGNAFFEWGGRGGDIRLSVTPEDESDDADGQRRNTN